MDYHIKKSRFPMSIKNEILSTALTSVGIEVVAVSQFVA